MNGDIRALVVDDDFRVASIHTELVDNHPGFSALEPAHTLAEARRAVRDHAPDLLVVDVFLPDGDGITLVDDASIDALVVTAAADAETVRRAVHAGALTLLAKPFDPKVLTDRLDRYARFRNLLGDTALTQTDIDRALGVLHPDDIPSPSRTATEDRILRALGPEEVSASVVAAEVGISRATAQRHLTALTQRGLVEMGLRYGTAGRPEHRYVRKNPVGSL